MARTFLILALLMLHMVQPLVANPLCAPSDIGGSDCGCCAMMDASPMQDCCLAEEESEEPFLSQLGECGCSLVPVVPTLPALAKSIELNFDSLAGGRLRAEPFEPSYAGSDYSALRGRFVCPVECGPPLRLLTQAFRL